MTCSHRVACTALACACAIVVSPAAQAPTRRPAERLDAIATVLDAFRTHAVVALGEGPHGNEQAHAFRLALLRDPRFADTVNDIVVESGSANDQAVADRFVRGEDVPPNALRDLLEQSAGAAPAWERPIYVEFFQAVRDVNRSRPADRKLRVLLGDPPIDWSLVKTPADYRPWGLQRDSHPAALIQREVLARSRKALVIYGDGHFQARRERPGRSLVGFLETAGTPVFIITSTFVDLARFEPAVASWRAPAAAMLQGTTIGAAPYEEFFGPAPPTDFFRANPRLEDHYDAVIWLGPSSSRTMSPILYPRCAEPDYVAMRVGRMVATGLPPTVRERLAQECLSAKPQP
jgi:hypothetical protein